MCQPRARATPCQLGAGSLPSSSRDSCLVTGAHLQPAQATPGEAVASACTWLRAITSLHPLLPHPSYLGESHLLLLPQPTTNRLCPYLRQEVHSSREAMDRPRGSPPHIPKPLHLEAPLRTGGE